MTGAGAEPLAGRLFFALPVPPASKAPLLGVLPELARALPRARLTDAGGWHLTLAFLGHVQPEQAAAVAAVGERAVVGVPPLHLCLEGAGCFPSRSRARVVWAGVGGDVGALRHLAAELASGCREAGLRYDGRELHPHLTLARLNPPAPAPERLLARIGEAAASAPGWEARSLACYRSDLGRHGARYRVLREFPLAGR